MAKSSLSWKARQALIDSYEERTHLSATMLQLGWHAIGWTGSGRPNMFSNISGLRRWDLTSRKAWLIVSTGPSGKYWALRYSKGRIAYFGRFGPLPTIVDVPKRFKTAAEAALTLALRKWELPK